LPYRILREGAVSRQEILKVLSKEIRVVGITGGTGSGKTTALSLLRNMGALVLDCDALYHELLDTSEPMKRELTERFGQVYVDGVLDRKALGELVFSDQDALADLNRITHKYVGEEVDRRLGEWALAGGKLAAIDAIALLESGLSDRCNMTIGVTAPDEVRIKRIMAREGISEEYAQKRLKAQKTNGYFEEHCDYTIHNSGTKEEFLQSCRSLFERLNL
jgi:dephospho-CoA kinase